MNIVLCMYVKELGNFNLMYIATHIVDFSRLSHIIRIQVVRLSEVVDIACEVNN